MSLSYDDGDDDVKTRADTIQQDTRYLKPIVTEIEAEQTERADWDAVKLDRSNKH